MSVTKELLKRSGNACELCGNSENLKEYVVAPSSETIVVCDVCEHQIENTDERDANHWRCLNDSMWSTIPAVQVMAWRMLSELRHEGWPQGLLDMLYLDEDTMEWAKATGVSADKTDAVVHRDSNGVVLEAGDSVVLIKDLPVKGSSMVAKRGTAVRRISLDPTNAEYIEGKVDGQTIVIITKFVKKM